MAQVVLIDTGTHREGINSIGDIVSIYDDDVMLGDSYKTFKVIRVPGSAKDVIALINSKIPEVKKVFRSSANAGEWTDQPPEEKEVWNDNGAWREIVKHPKYRVNLTVKEDLTNALTDKVLSDSSKLSLVGAAASPNLKSLSENQATVTIVTAAEAKTA